HQEAIDGKARALAKAQRGGLAEAQHSARIGSGSDLVADEQRRRALELAAAPLGLRKGLAAHILDCASARCAERERRRHEKRRARGGNLEQGSAIDRRAVT